MDPAAEGITYPDLRFTVDPDRVAAFALVVGQDAPGVPPTFLTAAEFSVIPRIIGDPRLALDFTRVVHGTQEYVLERPLRVGETLVLSPSLESVRVRAGTGFLTIRVDVRDEAGAPVATTRSMMIERGPDA
jgi:N-terminal half of MaoC dehydratase